MKTTHRSFGPLLGNVRCPALEVERERVLVQGAQAGDETARAELVMSHLRLVAAVARRVSPRPSEDVLAEGLVGLLEGIARFDPSLGFRLSTYASHRIRARVQRYVLANRNIVGAPDTRASRRVFGGIGRVERALATSTHDPATEEIAAELGVTCGDVDLALGALRTRDVAFDPETGRSEESAQDPEEQFADAELAAARHQVIARTLAGLSSRERRVVQSRALSDEGVTLEQLAESFSLSRERVRQIESRVLRRIGEALLIEGLGM